MKKYHCLICNSLVNENETHCSYCHSEINQDIVFKRDSIEVLKHNVKLNAIACEYKRNLNLLIETYDELVLEYYKMYCSKAINKPYNETDFFDKKLNYTDEELDMVIVHMIEHSYLFTMEKIKAFSKLSKSHEKILRIIENIEVNEDKKGEDKDLRELLFTKTVVPSLKPIDPYYKEAKSFLYISIILYIVLYLVVILVFDKTIQYELMNITFILPSVILARALTRYILKKKNIFFTILMFISIYYSSTLLGSIIWNGIDFNIFFNHMKNIIKTPEQLIKALIERLRE